MGNISYPPFSPVKEIYLPFNSADNGITLEQYKDKYGIDLRDFFSFEENAKQMYLKRDKLQKYYLVFIDGIKLVDGGVRVTEPVETSNENGETGYALVYDFAEQIVSIPVWVYWDNTNEKLVIVEY